MRQYMQKRRANDQSCKHPVNTNCLQKANSLSSVSVNSDGESPERGPEHSESPADAGVPGGSQSPEDPAGDSKPRLAAIRADVREVFEYFNAKTGSQIPPHPANLLPIQEILEDTSFGATVETAKLAIDWCWSEWRDSKAMCGNIRIKTIFKPSNFSGYAENGRRKFSKHSRIAAPKQFGSEIERLEHEFVAIRDKVEAARAEASWTGNSFREQRAAIAKAFLAKGEPLLAAAQRALEAARAGSIGRTMRPAHQREEGGSNPTPALHSPNGDKPSDDAAAGIASPASQGR